MSTYTTRIALFGAFELAHGDMKPLRPPTQRTLALLGYLIAHHDVPHGREKLVDLLWPALPPRQGRRMLSDTLWRARRLLTPPDQIDTPTLRSVGDTVTFCPTPSVTVDLLAFAHHLQQAPRAPDGAEHLRAAVALYRGDLLEACYDDWALGERERRREQYLGALQQLRQHDQARGAYDLALQSALRLVRADPLREEAHRALMRLYYLLGREADAVRVFAQCRAALLDELGVEPEPETLSLYDEIVAMQQRRAGSSPLASTLASAPTFAIANDLPFIGRSAARADVIEAVEAALDGTGGLLLLSGAAGQGKSRLLREIAVGAAWRGAQVSWGHAREDAQACPFDPLRQALLAALPPLRAREMATRLPPPTLDALLPLLPELIDRLPEYTLHLPSTDRRPAAALHAALASVLLALGQLAPQLLILEDLHWFDPASLDALAAILPALRGARVLLLVSTRADELVRRAPVWRTLLRLDRTGLLRRVTLSGLSEAEVAELVRRALRMRHDAPRFSARLAQTTGGNPFFVLETLRALVAQGTLRRDGQGRWHTPWDEAGSDYGALRLPEELRQAIATRVGELGAAEQATLAAAAVLGQSFAPAALARMTAAPTVAVATPLVQRQFLVEDTAGYRFEHETLREVIYTGLDEHTRQGLHLRAAEALEHEHHARVEALAQHLYLAGAWDKAVPYLVQAGDHARAVCAYRDALRCYDQALAAADHLCQPSGSEDPAARWAIYLKRGELFALLSEYSAAIGAYEQALALTELRGGRSPIDRRSAHIQALNGLCYIYGQRNDYERAQCAIQRALELAAASPRLIDRADVCYQAGLISFRREDFGEARRRMAEALQLYEALGRDAERPKCLLQIGFILLRQEGPTSQVIAYFTEALDLYRQQGDRFAEHSCLADISGAYLNGGRLVDAVETAERCLAFFRSISAQDDVASCLYTRGEACRRLGRHEEALAALRESLDICMRLERGAAAEVNQIALAATLRDLERYDEAYATIAGPLRTGYRTIKLLALLVAADIGRLQHAADRAWRQLEEGLALARALGSKIRVGVAYRLLGQLRAADHSGQLPPPGDDLPDAERSFAESARLLQAAHAEDELALSWLAYGQYLHARSRTAEARAALIQARNLLARCGISPAMEQVQRQIQTLSATPESLLPGQRRVTLARHGVPRGRPLRPDELIEVVWTLEESDQREVSRLATKVATRQERLVQLCAEALAQGAEPTVADLAEALRVTPRTVDRDIAALRAAGTLLTTRGSG